MYAIMYTDANETGFIRTDLNEPLSEKHPIAYFAEEEDASNYAADAYEVLTSMVNDWKSITLTVGKANNPAVVLNADGNNLY